MQRFLTERLLMTGNINADVIDLVERAAIPSGPGVREEAVVRFRDVQTRDQVIGSAAKLANCMDDRGKATAGMRMEVPPELRQHFRVLFKYGQTLRTRHGQGTRRRVKFDDVARTLYLNVKLPGDETWSKVLMDLATKGMRAKEMMNDGEIERRLDITGPAMDPPRQRATSVLTYQAVPGTSRNDTWTGRRAPSQSTSS